MNRREAYLDEFRVIFVPFLEGTRDARKRVNHLFLGFFFEIGIGFDRENIWFGEFESSDVPGIFGDIVGHDVDFDIGIVSVDLIFEEFRIFAINHEKESNHPVGIGDLETELWSGVRLVEKVFMFFEGIVEDIEDLFCHKDPLFIEAINRYFEDSFMCAQFFWE